jgi:hypothetical protein
VLAGLEDQLDGTVLACNLNSGGGGEFWIGDHRGLLFIGEGVRAASWQSSATKLQPNRGSVQDFDTDSSQTYLLFLWFYSLGDLLRV